MDKVNGIEMSFIYKKRGHSPDTYRLWAERKKLLKPEKIRRVGKGTDNERIQEYRPFQQVHKRIVELNIQMYNRFFSYCETLGTTPLKEFHQNNHESWTGQNPSDTERRTSNVRPEKCPTSAIKKFRKHETVNLIQLKQTVKKNTLDDEHNERTEETIKKAEKDFSLDLLILPKIVIPEAMRPTVVAMLHQGHPSASKMDQSAAAFWWPGLYREIREKAESCPSCRASGKNLTTQLPSTEKTICKFYLNRTKKPNWTSPVQ